MPSTTAISIPARALSGERVMVRTSDTALTGMETSSTSRMPVRPPARERKDASTMNWVTLGSQGLLDAYLAHALLHGDEHDVRYSEASDDQGECSDNPSGPADAPEDGVQHIQQEGHLVDGEVIPL